MTNNFWDQPEYLALYKISIEELGLSSNTNDLLKSMGVTSVGDCIDYHIRKHDLIISASLGYREAMENEVKDKLQEYSYWSFYENAMRAPDE